MQITVTQYATANQISRQAVLAKIKRKSVLTGIKSISQITGTKGAYLLAIDGRSKEGRNLKNAIKLQK